MKTTAKLTGFAMMLSFLAFVWLSHTGVIGGSYGGNFWGGVGMLILAFCGWFMLALDQRDSDDKLFNPLMFSYGLLLIANAVFYTVLKTANLIGPYPPVNDSGLEVVLGFFYLLLAVGGLAMMIDISKNRK